MPFLNCRSTEECSQKAICNQTFVIHIAFEQLLAVKFFVVRILSRILSVGIFNDRLYASEFLTFFSRLIFSSRNLLRDFSRPLTFCVIFYVKLVPSDFLLTDFSCKTSPPG